MNIKQYDRIILGAGIYGLYAAIRSLEKGLNVLVIEHDKTHFSRGTYINQARVHNGYHYPRSRSTAVKSRDYFDKFVKDYPEAINQTFRKVYAISNDFSWTSGEQFEKFCLDNKIPFSPISESLFFTNGTTDGVYDTLEYSFDAKVIGKLMMDKCLSYKNFEIVYNQTIESITNKDAFYNIKTQENEFKTEFLLNATYASTNQVLRLLNLPSLNIKYELCEIILCKVSDNIKDVGITVMDGPFFSMMPFGLTGLHSLTSVTFTPHKTSYDEFPTFDCQKERKECTPHNLQNCNDCPFKPKSAWPKMMHLAKKYLKDDIKFEYVNSLFTIKPILKTTEIDDSRPTVIKQYSEKPTFITVFSGKINTIYDLDDVI